MFTPGDSLTAQNAKVTLEQGLSAIAAGQREFDLGAIATVDSSAVAVLLAWQRRALAINATLVFNNLSANLQSLADMYGVDHFLHPEPKNKQAADVAHH